MNKPFIKWTSNEYLIEHLSNTLIKAKLHIKRRR